MSNEKEQALTSKRHKLLINEPPLQVLPTLAASIGLGEALIIQQLHYLTVAYEGKTIEGTKWVRMSDKQWRNQFPFWGRNTIRRLLDRLETTLALIKVGNFNERNGDKTQWYAIDYAQMDCLPDKKPRKKRADYDNFGVWGNKQKATSKVRTSDPLSKVRTGGLSKIWTSPDPKFGQPLPETPSKTPITDTQFAASVAVAPSPQAKPDPIAEELDSPIQSELLDTQKAKQATQHLSEPPSIPGKIDPTPQTLPDPQEKSSAKKEVPAMINRQQTYAVDHKLKEFYLPDPDATWFGWSMVSGEQLIDDDQYADFNFRPTPDYWLKGGQGTKVALAHALPKLTAPEGYSIAYSRDGYIAHLFKADAKQPSVCTACHEKLGTWSNGQDNHIYAPCCDWGKVKPKGAVPERIDPLVEWVAVNLLHVDVQVVLESKRMLKFAFTLVGAIVRAAKRELNVKVLSYEQRQQVAEELTNGWIPYFLDQCKNCTLPQDVVKFEKWLNQWYKAGKPQGGKHGGSILGIKPGDGYLSDPYFDQHK